MSKIPKPFSTQPAKGPTAEEALIQEANAIPDKTSRSGLSRSQPNPSAPEPTGTAPPKDY